MTTGTTTTTITTTMTNLKSAYIHVIADAAIGAGHCGTVRAGWAGHAAGPTWVRLVPCSYSGQGPGRRYGQILLDREMDHPWLTKFAKSLQNRR